MFSLYIITLKIMKVIRITGAGLVSLTLKKGLCKPYGIVKSIVLRLSFNLLSLIKGLRKP